MTIAELNAASLADFCAALRGVWEHSPWIVAVVASRRPFPTRTALAQAMEEVVREADAERQMALLRAHPDLAGKLARAGGLTAESTREQSSAGLDQLSDAEYARFSKWNATYRERFGFPFIICVRENTRASIEAAFLRRLENDREAELSTALAEVHKIAAYRLADCVFE